ncbi:MAG: crossover junction endodeoxyribonuclease RuvC [Flavobacteriales bacterium]|jgi:crossover junction endodeoxyribonuclease RuvC|nr:crossover junction endodeoxyribonuclease RuvC [Flavobacteriales bacterium]
MSNGRRADIDPSRKGGTAKSRPAAVRGAEAYDRIILGIDPGTTVMGFGVVAVAGSELHLIEAGAIRFDPEDDHTLKLRAIFGSTIAIIERHLPDELAIEAQFFGKNVQSMLKLGRAQGVAIAAALQRELSVVEYAPKRVKQSITGNGNAAKEQVAAMLLSILRIKDLPSSTDATDAVAVAVCHHFANSGRITGVKAGRGGAKDWSAFIRNNPDRVR